MQILPNMCLSCIHLQGEPFNVNLGPPKCAAFPDRIPSGFWVNGAPHISPDQDGGITWELDPAKEDFLDAYLGFWGIALTD